MKKFLAMLLVLVMVLLLAACGGKEAPAAEAAEAEAPTAESPVTEAPTEARSNRIGIAMPTKDQPRWSRDGANMKARLEAAGYNVDLQYAADDIATQISQISNMIANDCEVLVIAPIDGQALGTVLEQAKVKGIPVIAYDRLIMNSDAVSYYAAFDNWDVGVKQGRFIAEALDLANANGKHFHIEYITGDPGDSNTDFYFEGALSVLQPYIDAGILRCPSGQTEKQTVATANWDVEAAQARFETILTFYYSDGTELHAVLASDDFAAQGVANALACAYRGNYPVLTGQGCDIASVKNMIAEKQAMSVFKDTRMLAAKTVEMVDALMKGTEPPVNDTETYDNGTGLIPSYLCEARVCTVDEIQAILVDAGYYTADQLED